MKKIETFEGKGIPSQPDERIFRQKLESIQREINKPNQYKGRISELSSRVRFEEQSVEDRMDTLDAESLEKITKVCKNIYITR